MNKDKKTNLDFIKKIEGSKEQVANGDYIVIKDTKNIWERIVQPSITKKKYQPQRD